MLAVNFEDIERFLDEYLLQKTRRTATAYQSSLRAITRFAALRSHHVDTPAALLEFLMQEGSDMAQQLIDDYLVSDTSTRQTTRVLHIANLDRLLRQALKKGLISWRLDLEELPTTQAHTANHEGTNRAHIAKALKHLKRNDAPSAREAHAIILILHRLALRTSEVVELDVEHFRRNALSVWSIRQHHRKTPRTRIWFPMPSDVANSVAAWMKVRGKAPGPLFPAIRDERIEHTRLKTEGLQRLLDRVAAQSGVPALKARQLAYAGISDAYERGGRDEAVRLSRYASTSYIARFRKGYRPDDRRKRRKPRSQRVAEVDQRQTTSAPRDPPVRPQDFRYPPRHCQECGSSDRLHRRRCARCRAREAVAHIRKLLLQAEASLEQADFQAAYEKLDVASVLTPMAAKSVESLTKPLVPPEPQDPQSSL